MVQLFFYGEGSVTWETKCLNKLVRLCIDHITDRPFLLKPSFHNDDFPRLELTQSLRRQSGLRVHGYHIIDNLDVVFTVSSYEVFIESLFVEFLGEE